LRQKHTVQTLVKIEEFQRKQRQIEHSIFKLLKLVQVMRNRGYSLRAEEEILITRLVAMDRDLAKPSVFRGRLNEVWSHISQMRDADDLNLGNEFSLVDPNSLEPVCKVLEGIGKGLSQLTMVVKEDEASLEKISRGYQDP
jgi:nuclear pore complex protein Nup54